MATAGKVPTLGFLGRIKNLVWLGFGAGASSGSTLPDVIRASLRSHVEPYTLQSLQPSMVVRSHIAKYTLRYRG